MRIVIDLQAAQSPGSRVRGIGRYSLALAEAMAKLAAGEHEVWVALNHAVADTIEPLRTRFAPLVGEERIVVWESLHGVSGGDAHASPRRIAAEFLRERFLAQLAPDIVHVSSLFEGWGDDTVTSVGKLPGDPLQAVTLYDLIPYVRRETYLTDPRVRSWYMEKIRHLCSADLLLAISEFTRQEAIDVLGAPAERVVNISGACDPLFHRLDERERRRVEGRVRSRHHLPGQFVLYTGGFDGRKNIDGLIRAFAALRPELRHGRQLAIVGHGPAAEIQRLRALAGEAGLGANDVVFTGYVDDADLCALYNFCDLYVFPSFHEGFGLPALEAMACGAAVIGSRATSLVEVIGFERALFDPSCHESMAGLMGKCLEQEAFRQELREHAETQVARFSWSASAERALAGMIAARGSTGRTTLARGDTALDEAASALARLIDDDAEYAQLRRPLARALALNLAAPDAPRRMFVDVTMLADVDVGTGIQRVVRNILRELLAAPPPGFEILPVRLVAGTGYVHARAFAARFVGAGPEHGPDTVIDPQPGDMVLGLDLIAHLLPDEQAYFRWLRERGVALWFVVYDLLPVLRPEYFPPGGLGIFQRWYQAVGEIADGVLCISRAVADELSQWYDQIQPARSRPLRIGHFHLGADLQRDAGGHAIVAAPRDRMTFLMVGTVERRKGHAQVLAAFEQLWAQGVEARLVVVGKSGWLVDDLMQQLRIHAENSDRLVWLEHASDQELLALYGSASALLMASEGEGFGLPLIEAAQHGVPLIARNLQVFREVAGDGAFYFEGEDADSLAHAIEEWLALQAKDRHPRPQGVSWLTWSQSAARLQEVMLGGQADLCWQVGRRYVISAADPRIASQNGRLERGVLRPDGAPGYLVYGPYSRIEEGHYEVRVVLDVPDGASRAELDLTAFASDEVMYRRHLSEVAIASTRLELAFELVAPRLLESFQVRLLLPAGDRTAFVSCTLTPSGGKTPEDEESPKSTMEPIDA